MTGKRRSAGSGPLDVLLGVLLVLGASPAAWACGEAMFNMGKGLRYQGYLTPRPATVLVYDSDPMQRRDVYVGLYRAGHKLTVVKSTQDLTEALQQGRFDVVISTLSQVDDVRSRAGKRNVLLLPVVQRSQRNAPEVRDQFRVFLIDGASLGQYLKGIERVLAGASA